MNMQCCLIQELRHYVLELGHNVSEAIIFCVKGEGAVDHNTVSRGCKKFRSCSKNLGNQVSSSRPKTVDSKTILQMVNLTSSTRRVSGDLGISVM